MHEPRTPSPKTVTPAMMVHALLEVGLRLAFLVDAHVAGAHAYDAVTFDEDLRSRKAGVDLDAQLLAFLGQELHHVGERHDVVALLLEEGRCEERGQLEREVAEKLPEVGLVAGLFDRETLLLVVGHELLDALRVHDATGELVVADARGLLDHEDHGGLDGLLAALLAGLVVLLDLLHQVIGR